MYILTFKYKTSDLFGSSGVYDTLKQIKERILDCQCSRYEGKVFGVNYCKPYAENISLDYSKIENYLKRDLKKFCTTEIEGDYHLWNIREQKDIKRID